MNFTTKTWAQAFFAFLVLGTTTPTFAQSLQVEDVVLPVEIENVDGIEVTEEIPTYEYTEDLSDYGASDFVPHKASPIEWKETEVLATVKSPKYKQHQKDYKIDKITYYKDHLVISFRFVGDTYSSAVFYEPEGAHAWLLKDKKGNTYPMKAVRNLRHNGQLIAEDVLEETWVNNDYDAKKNNFTCDVHFANLPKDVSVVDLIEGEGREEWSNHFNAFNIRIKQFDEPVAFKTEPAETPITPKPAVDNNISMTKVSVSPSYELFPNPNYGQFSITNKGEQQDARVEVLDLLGKVVYNQQITLQEKGTHNFQVQHLAAGQYLVRVQNGKTSETLKMVILQ